MTKILKYFTYDGVGTTEDITFAKVKKAIKERDDNRTCTTVTGLSILESCQKMDIDKIKRAWKKDKSYKQQSKRCKKLVREALKHK